MTNNGPSSRRTLPTARINSDVHGDSGIDLFYRAHADGGGNINTTVGCPSNRASVYIKSPPEAGGVPTQFPVHIFRPGA